MSAQRRGASLLLALLLAACAAAPAPGGIRVADVWARPVASAGGTTGLFFRIENVSEVGDRLLGAETALAESVEIHQTMMEGDVMQMRPLSEVPIPAGGSVVFEPGGLHMMVLGVAEPLAVGERFAVTLRFERAGNILVEAEVREP